MMRPDSTTLVSSDLDDRIAAAFADGAKSDDVASLIREAEAAAIAAGDVAAQARLRAHDPALSAPNVATARREMDDLAFRRERRQAAISRLQKRLYEVRAHEENDRRAATYAKVKAERDRLAAELADAYPAIERQLVDLFTRLDANNIEVKNLNARPPPGAERLIVAELVARGLTSFLKDATQIERMTDQLRLPAFERPVHRPLAWPPSR